jgi:hypothetical protein
MTDLINHPPHYTSHPSGVECIDVTEHFNFNIGSAIKYLWRHNYKHDPISDLKKAKWYIDREIGRILTTSDKVSVTEMKRDGVPDTHIPLSRSAGLGR